MSDETRDKPRLKPKVEQGRGARVAEALRANLRRRKDAARQRQGGPPDTPDEDQE